MRARLASIVLTLAIPSRAYGQHEGHTHPPAETTDANRHGEMGGEAQHVEGALGLPMSRIGSGTAWLPDDAPVRAFLLRSGGWHLMLHGNVFVGYDYQAGDAGDGELVSQNWLMAMAGHELAGGHFTARAMLSLEPLTVGRRGYPLLLQTGEQIDGVPLVDRQHPHDLIMEAAALYERDLTDRLAFHVYAALAGEPALGPVGFPHRPSAMMDPLAPLGHHWQDSTHISFGVLTAGLFTRTVKLGATFARAEYVTKTGHDLALDPAMENETFGVAMFSVGHTHPVLSEGGLETSLGLRGSAGVIDAELESRYGTRFPLGLMAYLQIQPQPLQGPGDRASGPAHPH